MDNCYLHKRKCVETVVGGKELGVRAIKLGQFFSVLWEKVGSGGVDYLVEDSIFLPLLSAVALLPFLPFGVFGNISLTMFLLQH